MNSADPIALKATGFKPLLPLNINPGFKPIPFEYQSWFQNVPFKFNLRPLRFGLDHYKRASLTHAAAVADAIGGALHVESS